MKGKFIIALFPAVLSHFFSKEWCLEYISIVDIFIQIIFDDCQYLYVTMYELIWLL